MAHLSFALKKVAVLFCQFYGCGTEALQRQEQASGSNGTGSAVLNESSVYPGSILAGCTVMMMRRKSTVPSRSVPLCLLTPPGGV